jgi:hypothetical protein
MIIIELGTLLTTTSMARMMRKTSLDMKQMALPPSALEYKMNGGRSFAQAVSDAIYVLANPFPIRAGEWQSAGTAPQFTSPPMRTPKKKSALRSISFAPVVMNPPPTLDDAVGVDPDFFEGATQDGAGPGPHFLTMSFIKGKSKI